MVDDDGTVAGRGRGAGHGAQLAATVASRSTPRSCGKHPDRRTHGGRPPAGGGIDASASPTRARRSWPGIGRRVGRARRRSCGRTVDRLGVRAAGRTGMRRRLTAITGLELDPYFVAPKLAWLRDQLGADAASRVSSSPRPTSGCCTACAAPSSPTRRPLPARCSSTSDAARGASEAAGTSASTSTSCPQIVGNADGDRCHDGVRRPTVPVAGACVDQQAALFAESLPGARRGEVHLRDRRLPARHAPATASRAIEHRPRRLCRPGGWAGSRRGASTARCSPSARPCPG